MDQQTIVVVNDRGFVQRRTWTARPFRREVYLRARAQGAVPFERLTAVHQPSHLVLAEGGAGGDLDEAVKVSRYIS